MSGGATLSLPNELWGSDNQGIVALWWTWGERQSNPVVSKLILGENWLAVRVCSDPTTEWVRNRVLVRVRAILISLIWSSIPYFPPQIQPIPILAMEVTAEPCLYKTRPFYGVKLVFGRAILLGLRGRLLQVHYSGMCVRSLCWSSKEHWKRSLKNIESCISIVSYFDFINWIELGPFPSLQRCIVEGQS